MAEPVTVAEFATVAEPVTVADLVTVAESATVTESVTVVEPVAVVEPLTVTELDPVAEPVTVPLQCSMRSIRCRVVLDHTRVLSRSPQRDEYDVTIDNQ